MNIIQDNNNTLDMSHLFTGYTCAANAQGQCRSAASFIWKQNTRQNPIETPPWTCDNEHERARFDFAPANATNQRWIRTCCRTGEP